MSALNSEKPVNSAASDAGSTIGNKHHKPAASSGPSSDSNSVVGEDDLQAIKTNPNKELDGSGLEKSETVYSAHHPNSFPDGGREAWLSVLGGFCAAFCSFGKFPAGYRCLGLVMIVVVVVLWICELQEGRDSEVRWRVQKQEAGADCWVSKYRMDQLHRYLPGILSDASVEGILAIHNLMDYEFGGLL